MTTYEVTEPNGNGNEHQMANIAQWRMYDDAMKRAQASLVNYQHKQHLPLFWDDGTTSSSDGMRVQVGVSSLTSDHNPHYGSKKGATMYRLRYSILFEKVRFQGLSKKNNCLQLLPIWPSDHIGAKTDNFLLFYSVSACKKDECRFLIEFYPYRVFCQN